ncbi:MAG TPA: FAD:protein FMN transferase [Candidatus Saccharimonadales bacterium]|nr:FAD:protein FMN transferase [Candidatus Saccharimonadales bacterium]
MRRTEQIMGMPIGIDIDGCDDEAVFEKAFTRLREIDERFSTYKQDSEVSKYKDGKLTSKELSPELKEVIKACRDAEKETDGYFSAWATGAFDPSGYVKGWAIAETGKLIERLSCQSYCIGAGGDILARSDGSRIWAIGVQNPTDKTKVLTRLDILSGAVATSGNYERGSHIINPKSGRTASSLLSITVVGPDIITADILATAGFAMGAKALEMVEQKGYEALIVNKDGQIKTTPGFTNLSRRSPESSR